MCVSGTNQSASGDGVLGMGLLAVGSVPKSHRSGSRQGGWLWGGGKIS